MARLGLVYESLGAMRILIMPRVLVDEKGVKLGAYRFPGRKKPCLCVEKGNEIIVYGSFINDKAAENFMHELAVLVNAKEEV